LGTDGMHLGRPPAGAPTRVAQIILPQNMPGIPAVNYALAKVAPQLSGAYRSMYFDGVMAAVRGDIALLDAEMPAANGVATARALARMYGAIANGGEIDGTRFLSPEIVAGLTGRPSRKRDRNILVPLSFHLGYHSVPFGGVMPGFGHVGLGGSFGWADPASGLAFAYVHNRLLSPFLLLDHSGVATLGNLVRLGVTRARKRGFAPVSEFGASFRDGWRGLTG
jgi:CubicO group peptidase (beta-lactamase class C family)